MRPLESLIDEYLRFVFRTDPIGATRLGVHDHDDELGALELDAVDAACADRRELLRRFEALDPSGLDAAGRMDLEVALADLRTAVRRDEDQRVWARAPYWYAERLGQACGDLMAAGHPPLEARGRSLAARLRAAGRLPGGRRPQPRRG